MKFLRLIGNFPDQARSATANYVGLRANLRLASARDGKFTPNRKISILTPNYVGLENGNFLKCKFFTLKFKSIFFHV